MWNFPDLNATCIMQYYCNIMHIVLYRLYRSVSVCFSMFQYVSVCFSGSNTKVRLSWPAPLQAPRSEDLDVRSSFATNDNILSHKSHKTCIISIGFIKLISWETNTTLCCQRFYMSLHVLWPALHRLMFSNIQPRLALLTDNRLLLLSVQHLSPHRCMLSGLLDTGP